MTEVAVASALEQQDARPPPEMPPSASEARLLALLDRPRRGVELPALLGVTRQRVDQLIARVTRLDLIRSAEADHPTTVVARKDDLTLLLTIDQERVLSRFPDAEATTLSKIVPVISMRREGIAKAADALQKAGMIEQVGSTKRGDLYRLTAAGTAHWQRSPAAPRAETPSLPFRSERIRNVLAYVDNHAPVRTRDIAQGLQLPPISLNALMQYLKRNSLVRNETDSRRTPYVLTPDGRAMLAAMRESK